jgi:hypothetical protein
VIGRCAAKAIASALVAWTLVAAAGLPCSRVGQVDPAQNAREAEAIVVARAVEYVSAPERPAQDGAPQGSIVFDVVKSLKGRSVPTQIVLPGTLTGEDDFNPEPMPYAIVRMQGRGGWCFARTYRQGGLFLLLLQSREGEYTVEWDALAPNNEQLHGLDDPWIDWVHEHASEPAGKK